MRNEPTTAELAEVSQAHVDDYQRVLAHTHAVTKACGGREWNPPAWDDSPRGHGVSLRKVLADERKQLELAAAGGSVLWRIRLDDGPAFRCGCGCEAFFELAAGRFRCTKCALDYATESSSSAIERMEPAHADVT